MATEKVLVPDLGTTSDVSVIEVLVKPGDHIEKDTSIATLESEKASMEVPSPLAGEVKAVHIKVGDQVNQGTLLLTVETTDAKAASVTSEAKQAISDKETSEKPAKSVETATATAPAIASKVAPETKEDAIVSATTTSSSGVSVHAGPAVRRFARELGVDLSVVSGSGPKQRVVLSDVQSYVKNVLQNKSATGNFAVPAAPVIDFAKFGTIETKPLSKIKRLTGINVHRSWVTVPHVTQFDEADITELEQFRQVHKDEAEKLGFKLTPLVILMKAVVAGLKRFPTFNSSLDANGDNLIMKHYFHIGVAVDTPNGLVVPVIRDVDQKGLFQLADELAKISQKAREKGLTPAEMQGGCFTISSLGGIGGTSFTPIVNTPEVAILGVSKSLMKPVYQNGQFAPRLMLPLSLSYDHRVIDGAEGARFTSYLCKLLTDVRQLLF